LDGASDKRIVLLQGPAGIGKAALLADVQRTDAYRNEWLRFRCVPDATLDETLGQLLVRLGNQITDPPSLDSQTYDRICNQISHNSHRVVVLEDAHHLPIFADRTHHASLLEFLGFFCRSRCTPTPRLILVSERRGQFQFAGSHLLEPMYLEGLDKPSMLTLLQDLISFHSSRYPPPTIDELDEIAEKTRGHPFLGYIATTILESCPAAEVVETLHRREEVRSFVQNRLLGRLTLSSIEERFLTLASTFRIPVMLDAFSSVTGAQTEGMVRDLVNRLLIHHDRDVYQLHPVVAEHFRNRISDTSEFQQYHRYAYEYYKRLSHRRSLSLDERMETVYHAVRCGGEIDIGALRLFAGPIRTALFEALREKDWTKANNASDRILDILSDDSVVRVAKAVALDAMGESVEATNYFDSVRNLDRQHVWLAIQFVKSNIRRRDYERAEEVLQELEHRFGAQPQIQLAWAQLFERRGLTERALEKCQLVLNDAGCHWSAPQKLIHRL
jgi:hypothetical protein